MKKTLYILVLVLTLFQIPIKSQTILEVEPLFEYPTAPEELETIQDKCNYLVKNFWNNFDSKKKKPVDQYALNEAFEVYCTAFQFASAKEIESSLNKLLKNLSGNQIMLMQFCKAAEENLYGPRADMWSDELYLRFLDAVIKDKKIPAVRKTRYVNQAGALRSSSVGSTAPSFDFKDAQGESKMYFPMSTPTLLIFGNPENTDWILSRLKMDSNFNLDEALKQGKVNILFIVDKNLANWQDKVTNYNSRWTIGEAENISSLYDLRLTPTIYLVDSMGKIVNKNLGPEAAVNLLLQLVN